MFSLLFLISAVASASDISDQCQQGMGDIFSSGGDSNVGIARDTLDNFFYENCLMGDDGNVVCEVEGDTEPYMRTEMSYETLIDDENYLDFAAACRDMGEGYEFCIVDTTYQNETQSKTRIGEPVCVPPSCSIDDTDLAVVVSAQQHNDDECEGQEDTCEVPKPTSIAFNCGGADRQADTSTATCDEASKTTTDALQEYKSSLDSSVMFSCLAALGATDAQLPCKISMDPLKSSITGNFDGIVDQTVYKEFESTCTAIEEAQFCTISYKLELGFDLVIGSGDITMDMSHSPGCFPLGCSKEDMTSYVPSLADENFVNAMFEKTGGSRRRLSASRTAVGEFQRKVLARRLQFGFTDEATPGDGLDFFLGGNDTMPDGVDLDFFLGGGSSLPDEADMEVPSLTDLCVNSAQGQTIDSESAFWCTFQVNKMQCNGDVLIDEGTSQNPTGEDDGEIVVDSGETGEGDLEDNAATIYIDVEENDENAVGTGGNVGIEINDAEESGEIPDDEESSVETIVDVDSEVQRSSSSGAPLLAAKLLFTAIAVLYFVGL